MTSMRRGRITSKASRALLQAICAGAPPHELVYAKASAKTLAREEAAAKAAAETREAMGAARRAAQEEAVKAAGADSVIGSRLLKALERPLPSYASIVVRDGLPILALSWGEAKRLGKPFARNAAVPIPVAPSDMVRQGEEMSSYLDSAVADGWFVDVPVCTPLLYLALSADFRSLDRSRAVTGAPAAESSRRIGVFYLAALVQLLTFAEKAGDEVEAEQLKVKMEAHGGENHELMMAMLSKIADDYRAERPEASSDRRYRPSLRNSLHDSPFRKAMQGVQFAAFMTTVGQLRIFEATIATLLGLPVEDKDELFTPWARPAEVSPQVADACYGSQRRALLERTESMREAAAKILERDPLDAQASLLAEEAEDTAAEFDEEFPPARGSTVPCSVDGTCAAYFYYVRFLGWMSAREELARMEETK